MAEKLTNNNSIFVNLQTQTAVSDDSCIEQPLKPNGVSEKWIDRKMPSKCPSERILLPRQQTPTNILNSPNNSQYIIPKNLVSDQESTECTGSNKVYS
jgi:hypothetical protein